ncbi:MAG: aminodeoxychorismate/anthranilate synthase component II [Bacteroidetes bacterium]|nr:MAG: aminodeoxychorismate/anthranilate synthase component II [Bacteroidota bacterium]
MIPQQVFLLDNYDSFTFNLVQILEELGVEVIIKKNNKTSIEEIKQYSHILLSPGAGLPSEAGILLDVIRDLSPTHHILGVCLGHQAIAECFGGELFNLPCVVHGQKEICHIVQKDIIFKNIPTHFEVGLYHSWAVKQWNTDKIPLTILAKSQKNIIMALKHNTYKIWGVQFHPESMMTDYGVEIVKNWLES